MWEDDGDGQPIRRTGSAQRRILVAVVVTVVALVLCCAAGRELLRLFDVLPPAGIPLLGLHPTGGFTGSV